MSSCDRLKLTYCLHQRLCRGTANAKETFNVSPPPSLSSLVHGAFSDEVEITRPLDWTSHKPHFLHI